jgi:hypothetical protein
LKEFITFPGVFLDHRTISFSKDRKNILLQALPSHQAIQILRVFRSFSYRSAMEEEVIGEQIILSDIMNDDVNSLHHQISTGLDINQQFFRILGDLPDMLINFPHLFPLPPSTVLFSASHFFLR